MKTFNCTTSACRHCRHFMPEGRRGGNCQQLGVLVRGSWKACSLAIPAFAPSWEGIEGIVLWTTKHLDGQEVVPIECGALGCSDVEITESNNIAKKKNFTDGSLLISTLSDRH